MKTRTQDEMIEHLFNCSIIDHDTGCILWQGCTAGKGYGVVGWQGGQIYVHKLAYQFECPDEEQDVIRHTCDQPNCWRIEHLVNGTTQDNVDDKVAKRRHIFGSANYNTTFTEDDIVEIRSSPLNLYQLGAKYNVTPSTIHYIRARKTWKHVA